MDINESLKNEYSKFFRENKVLQHSVNGVSRFLILWTIKHNGKIHGYAIMKEIDEFFGILIDDGSLNKISPSKIYPILNKMEETGLITSNSEIQDNKELKFYEITDKGNFLLEYIRENYLKIKNTSKGSLFFEEFLD